MYSNQRFSAIFSLWSFDIWGYFIFRWMDPPVHKRNEWPLPPEENWISTFHRTLDESRLPLKYNYDYQKASDFEEAKKTTVRHIAIWTIEHSENKMVAYCKQTANKNLQFSVLAFLGS